MPFDPIDQEHAADVGPRARGIIQGVRGKVPWNGDGVATRNNPSFLRDHGFRIAYDLGEWVDMAVYAILRDEWRASPLYAPYRDPFLPDSHAGGTR